MYCELYEFGWFLEETGQVEWRQDEFWLGGPRVCTPHNIPRGTGWINKNYSNNKKLQVLESFSDRRTYSVEQVLTCVPFSSITFHSMEQEAVQSLASAFQQLEKCKSQFNIEDYSLSQTTLEQVLRNRKLTRNHQKQQLVLFAGSNPISSLVEHVCEQYHWHKMC